MVYTVSMIAYLSIQVTIEIETNPPAMDNPSGLPKAEEGEAFNGHMQKTFDYPASLLE